MEKTLYRSKSDRMVAGVCGGLAQYFDIDSSIIRLLFVLLALVGGSSVLLYIILAIVIPEESGDKEEIMDKDKKDEQKTEKSHSSATKNVNQGQLLGGIIIIIVGLIFLGNNFLPWLQFGKLWPLLLIIVGLWLLIKKERD